jgi:hypothetical protein
VNFATQPVSVSEVARESFGMEFRNHLSAPFPCYDLRTKYASLFGGSHGYVCLGSEVLAGLRRFVHHQRGLRACA